MNQQTGRPSKRNAIDQLINKGQRMSLDPRKGNDLKDKFAPAAVAEELHRESDSSKKLNWETRAGLYTEVSLPAKQLSVNNKVEWENTIALALVKWGIRRGDRYRANQLSHDALKVTVADVKTANKLTARRRIAFSLDRKHYKALERSRKQAYKNSNPSITADKILQDVTSLVSNPIAMIPQDRIPYLLRDHFINCVVHGGPTFDSDKWPHQAWASEVGNILCRLAYKSRLTIIDYTRSIASVGYQISCMAEDGEFNCDEEEEELRDQIARTLASSERQIQQETDESRKATESKTVKAGDGLDGLVEWDKTSKDNNRSWEQGTVPPKVIDAGTWGKMTIIEPPRTIRLIDRHGKEWRLTEDPGPILRPTNWRPPMSRKVFGRKRRRTGGVILIDASGSMGWAQRHLVKLCMALPYATVAMYSGEDGTGNLGIVAKDGWRVNKLDLMAIIAAMPGGNVVDGPALDWAVRQCRARAQNEPRIWLSDAGVTGCGDSQSNENLRSYCLALCRAKGFVRMEKREFMGALGI